jgi:membrane-associated phospholipid phosphatase
VTAPQAPGPAGDGAGWRRAVSRFDRRVDALLEPIRRQRAGQWLGRAASTAGDFSLVWQVVGAIWGLGVDRSWRHWLGFAALIGAESLVVNQGVKRIFRRVRPTETGDERLQVRRPRTSSFPSGHASAGCYAATLLTVWTGAAWAPLWFAIALVVASSRALVRIHHPSDVVAGAAFGALLAGIALLAGAARLFGR